MLQAVILLFCNLLDRLIGYNPWRLCFSRYSRPIMARAAKLFPEEFLRGFGGHPYQVARMANSCTICTIIYNSSEDDRQRSRLLSRRGRSGEAFHLKGCFQYEV